MVTQSKLSSLKYCYFLSLSLSLSLFLPLPPFLPPFLLLSSHFPLIQYNDRHHPFPVKLSFFFWRCWSLFFFSLASTHGNMVSLLDLSSKIMYHIIFEYYVLWLSYYRIFPLLSACTYIPIGTKPVLNSKVCITKKIAASKCACMFADLFKECGQSLDWSPNCSRWILAHSDHGIHCLKSLRLESII